jgi:cytosine deaminase
MPGLIDIHQHLDKSHTARRIPEAAGTLAGAVAAFETYARTASREDILGRAQRTAEACLARGTVAIRAHTTVDPVWGVRGIEALVELRERLAGRVRLQVAALVASGDPPLPTGEARALLEAALDAGADVIGGAPAFAAEPAAYLDMLFDVAVRRDTPLDLHLDETLDPAHQHLAYVARKTRDLRLGGRVVASHCCSLSALSPAEAAPLIAAVAEAGVGIVALPSSNLFLQGRDVPRLPPRGLTRVAELLRAGVRVAFGSDNIQDPFTPVGSGDLLETGRWLALAAHLGGADLPGVVGMATTVPAALMGLAADYGAREGACADLLIVDALDPLDALCSGPAARTVVYHGRHVAGPR